MESMAFKRSAVRSRLSPPNLVPETRCFRNFFIHKTIFSPPKSSFSKPAPETPKANRKALSTRVDTSSIHVEFMSWFCAECLQVNLPPKFRPLCFSSTLRPSVKLRWFWRCVKMVCLTVLSTVTAKRRLLYFAYAPKGAIFCCLGFFRVL